MDSVLESIFEFLFKYRPLLFQSGDVAFDVPVPAAALVGAAVAIVAVIGWTYLRAPGGSRRHRSVLAALRVAALAIVFFCLSRPVLRLPVVVPQENWLGVLLDDSRSMRIQDVDGVARGAWVENTFSDAESDLLQRLSERFRLRFFRFSGDAGRLVDAGALSFAGDRTRIGSALDRARAELTSVPLSGLVVVTDGADNSSTTPAASLLALEAAAVPVFTVGVGRESFERDIELVRVAAPASVLRGAAPVADVVVRQSGYEGRTVELVVSTEDRIVTTREIELGEDGEAQVVRVPVPAEEPGPHGLSFRIAPLEGERIEENNARETLVTVRDRREKILYFEGSPRFEVKFLRRAVAEDENLQLVSLVRTSEGRFLRLDVDSGEELAAGFPATREELFSYRALVLGSVEASFFSHEQLEMIADFVGVRGGGLLVLGGPQALAEGGWAGTPVAGILPVVLDDRLQGDTAFFAELDIEPTGAGAVHPALMLAEDEAASLGRWDSLPPLSTVNRVSGLKAGATALLTGAGPELPDGQVVLAHQRFGSGQAVVFAVQDTWIWQMHSEIAVDDPTHERLWRQLLRWLLMDTPDRLVAEAPVGLAAPGEPTLLRAELTDSSYIGINGASVVAHVTSPTGVVQEVPLEWTAEQDGTYAGRFTPVEEGRHQVRVEATHQGASITTAPVSMRVGDGDREFFEANMHASLLRRMADETGGRFYTPETVSNLPEDIAYTAKGITFIEENELWDMPINFLMIVGLVLAEWACRRRWGLA